MKKPSIPGTSNLPKELAAVIEPLKQNVEIITGLRGGSQIQPLASTAALSDVISKVNEIISRINQSG